MKIYTVHRIMESIVDVPADSLEDAIAKAKRGAREFFWDDFPEEYIADGKYIIADKIDDEEPQPQSE